MDRNEVKELALTAAKARLLAVEAVHRCASGHPGGSLSVMDALTVLYFHTMHIDPQNPRDPDRDRSLLRSGPAGLLSGGGAGAVPLHQGPHVRPP